MGKGKRGRRVAWTTYSQEIFIHVLELFLAGVKPALGAEDVGVGAENGAVEVGDPGVYADGGLQDVVSRISPL